MLRSARRLRRRFRILSLLPAAWWVWKQRSTLGGMAGFARTVPSRMRLGRGSEVALAAKVNLALLREPRLKGAGVRLGAVQGGDVCLEADRGSEGAADVARRLVEKVPGVSSVRVEDRSATPAPSTVAGRGVVADATAAAAGGEVAGDLADGAVEAPGSGEELPVRI